jgi:hypothetical protein
MTEILVDTWDEKGRPLDGNGRLAPSDMTDRELLEETVTRLRTGEDLITGVIESMKSNPMMRAMMPGSLKA